MTAFFKKHSTLILASMLVTLLILAWIIPSERLFLGITFVLFSFLIASLAVLEKHRETYQQGKSTRSLFLRNTVLEITGTGLAMVLAGLLGRAAALAAAQQIDHDILRVVTGLVIGLLVGSGVGALAKRTWGRFVKISSHKNTQSDFS
jgi:hypothetical protein